MIVTSGETEPTFSPDGRFIAYCSEGSGEIWLLEITTEEKEYLTDGSLPDWSPDGNEIVYVKGRNVYKIDVATKQIQQLTTWGSCFFPDWHPSNELLSFDFSYHTPRFDSFGIWILYLDDNSTKHLGGGRESNWSPCGGQLVYTGYVTGVPLREIFVMDSTGQNVIRLTNNQADDSQPAWSPDGSRIAYFGETRDTIYPFEAIGFNVWVMDTDGINKTQLTFEGDSWEPAWSPDGQQIVYVRSESYEKRNVIEVIYHLWIMDADGENKRQLTGRVTKSFGCK